MKLKDKHKMYDREIRHNFNSILDTVLGAKLRKARCSEKEIEEIRKDVYDYCNEIDKWEEANATLYYKIGIEQGRFEGWIAALIVASIGLSVGLKIVKKIGI